MSLKVHLEKFDGPLDLLLHLIDKNKVSIYDIPIVMITEQYLEYVRTMEEEDLDVMSEFVAMAAELLRIKSEMLLPKPPKAEGEEEIDPRTELVERLLEYKMYKYMSFELKDMMFDASHVIFKGDESVPDEIRNYRNEVDVTELMSEIPLERLQTTFNQLIARKNDRVDRVRSGFGKIEKEEIDLSSTIIKIQEFGIANRVFSFSKYILAQPSKLLKIVCFLSILELIKVGRVRCTQNEVFGEIMLEYLADDVIMLDAATA